MKTCNWLIVIVVVFSTNQDVFAKSFVEYKKALINQVKVDSTRAIKGIDKIICDNEDVFDKDVYLTAFKNKASRTLVRIEANDGINFKVLAYLSINTPGEVRSGKEILIVPEYLESGYNFEIHIDWDKSNSLDFNSNGITDYKIFPHVKLPHTNLNQWKGKKVVGLGTSVMFGRQTDPPKSYIVEAQKKLGFEYVNTSLPGMAIHAIYNEEGGITERKFGSSVLSISEYAAIGKTISANPVEAFSPNGSYNNHYRSWENIFKSENQDADLYIFAVTPNNNNFSTSDWDDFNKSTWSYNTGTFEDHRTTFLGALIYLFDKMYTFNPSARAVFVLDSEFQYDKGRTDFEIFAEEFNIPIIDLWGKSQFNAKTKKVLFSEGGTNMHPSTFAHEKMGAMLVNDLLQIY